MLATQKMFFLAICLIVFAVADSVGTLKRGRVGDIFGWKEYAPTFDAKEAGIVSKQLVGRRAIDVVGKPVYASITTISTRIKDVQKTIWQLLNGTVVPDMIYLFISSEPFLLDKGIMPVDLQANTELTRLIKFYPVKIIFTENIGPHRKLLPLLAKKWDEDCLIITFDDEPKFWLENYIGQLLAYYKASNGTSVVTLKARRLSFCHVPPFKVLSYSSWGEALYGMHEFFLLPTGTGGILYRPRFMNRIVFDRSYINITKTTDDLAFRLASMINGVFVVTGCRKTKKQVTVEYRHGSNISRQCSDGTFFTPSKSFPIMEDYKMSLQSSVSRNLSGGEPTHRRLEDAGLFGTFNRKKGNDNSFYSAIKFLHQKKLLDLSALAVALLPHERSLCFESNDFDVKEEFPGGAISCMITKCKRPNYSKSLNDELT